MKHPLGNGSIHMLTLSQQHKCSPVQCGQLPRNYERFCLTLMTTSLMVQGKEGGKLSFILAQRWKKKII